MRFTKTIIAAGLIAFTTVSLTGCYDHHPGQWGDHHHHDHDHDHDGNNWR